MKEYYSISLEDEEAQALLDITLLTDEPIKSFHFNGNIDGAIEVDELDYREMFWYDNHHVIGLYFSDSKISILPESLGNLSFLRFLVINSSSIQYIPFTIKNLKNLELFHFYCDPEINPEVSIDFPDIFKYLTSLKSFEVSGYYLIYIPPSFSELESLEELILEHCLISFDHSNFIRFKDNFLSTPVLELPIDYGKMKSLKKKIIKNIGLLDIQT